jgi:hypothetical protein
MTTIGYSRPTSFISPATSSSTLLRCRPRRSNARASFTRGVSGLITLYKIALHERNARPKGGWGKVAGQTGHYEMNHGEASKRAFVAKAQKELMELRPALLELGMMRP